MSGSARPSTRIAATLESRALAGRWLVPPTVPGVGESLEFFRHLPGPLKHVDEKSAESAKHHEHERDDDRRHEPTVALRISEEARGELRWILTPRQNRR